MEAVLCPGPHNLFRAYFLTVRTAPLNRAARRRLLPLSNKRSVARMHYAAWVLRPAKRLCRERLPLACVLTEAPGHGAPGHAAALRRRNEKARRNHSPRGSEDHFFSRCAPAPRSRRTPEATVLYPFFWPASALSTHAPKCILATLCVFNRGSRRVLAARCSQALSVPGSAVEPATNDIPAGLSTGAREHAGPSTFSAASKREYYDDRR